MTFITSELDNFALTLPITQLARRTAQEFAQQQPTPAKAQQVLLNTLSVWVVNDYLELISINADKTLSDSWNAVIRLCADVADLKLPGVGRLECRPLHLQQHMCYFPPETWEERVGYVVVQIDESLQEAKLLGFVPSVATEELPLSELQPLEYLIAHLEQIQQNQIMRAVNLRSWLSGKFEPGWQTVTSLGNAPYMRAAYAFRSSDTVPQNIFDQQEAFARRAKLIDLGIKIANQSVVLIVEVRPEVNQQTSVRLQLHPKNNEFYLLPGVQMTVLDESETVFLEAQARSADNYIQLQFQGEPGERFSVKVSLNELSIKEYFII
jgi:hypothetical protein